MLPVFSAPRLIFLNLNVSITSLFSFSTRPRFLAMPTGAGGTRDLFLGLMGGNKRKRYSVGSNLSLQNWVNRVWFFKSALTSRKGFLSSSFTKLRSMGI